MKNSKQLLKYFFLTLIPLSSVVLYSCGNPNGIQSARSYDKDLRLVDVIDNGLKIEDINQGFFKQFYDSAINKPYFNPVKDIFQQSDLWSNELKNGIQDLINFFSGTQLIQTPIKNIKENPFSISSYQSLYNMLAPDSFIVKNTNKYLQALYLWNDVTYYYPLWNEIHKYVDKLNTYQILQAFNDVIYYGTSELLPEFNHYQNNGIYSIVSKLLPPLDILKQSNDDVIVGQVNQILNDLKVLGINIQNMGYVSINDNFFINLDGLLDFNSINEVSKTLTNVSQAKNNIIRVEGEIKSKLINGNVGIGKQFINNLLNKNGGYIARIKLLNSISQTLISPKESDVIRLSTITSKFSDSMRDLNKIVMLFKKVYVAQKA